MKKKCSKTQPGSKRPVPAPSNCVRVGDIVQRRPISFSDSDSKRARRMSGTVVWVHPAGRFHVVEFEKGIHESFMGVKG